MTGTEPAWHNWRDRSWKHRVAYDAAAGLAMVAVAAALFLLGDLLAYGRVRW